MHMRQDCQEFDVFFMTAARSPGVPLQTCSMVRP